MQNENISCPICKAETGKQTPQKCNNCGWEFVYFLSEPNELVLENNILKMKNARLEYEIKQLKNQKPKVIENNKIWKDPDTDLIWQVEIDDKGYSFGEAFKYVEKLNHQNYGGYNNWRLPTIEELRTIVTENYYENSKSNTGKTYIKKPLLNSMTMPYQDFWSSTEYKENLFLALIVKFSNTNDFWSNKASSNYVRCVK